MEAARALAKEFPSAKVVILSAYSDDPYIQRAIEAGAVGYLMKETVGNDLVRAIREVAKGNAFFSPPIAKRLLTQCLTKSSNVCVIKVLDTLLTSRQREVLQLIAEGYSTKQIADVLSVGIKTAEKHRQDLMNTLKIHNIANLTRYALANGIVELKRVPDAPST